MTQRLRAVRERPPHERAQVIECRPGFDGPYFQGEGPIDCLCGECGHLLVKGSIIAFLTLYLCCPRCGYYNLAHGGDVNEV